jgi:hypothetical protein
MLMFTTIIKGQIWIYMLFEKEDRHCLVTSFSIELEGNKIFENFSHRIRK